jgi:hypothetical protein
MRLRWLCGRRRWTWPVRLDEGRVHQPVLGAEVVEAGDRVLRWQTLDFQTLNKVNFCIFITKNNFFPSTVKPVYNGHPWDLKKVAVWQRCLIKLRFRLAVDGSNWPLLTGGRCSQVVVKSGLTVFFFSNDTATESSNSTSNVWLQWLSKN